MDRVSELHVDGLPLHVVRPEESIIKCIPSSKWKLMSDAEKRKEKEKKTVVVTKVDLEEKLAFDEDGIVKVAGIMSRQISINGWYYLLSSRLNAKKKKKR